MARQYDDDDLDYDDEPQEREENPLKVLRQQNKKLQQQLKEFQEERDRYRTEARKSIVSRVVTTKGVNPKVAGLIPADLSSEEEINGWLDEYADLFGAATPRREQTQSQDQGDDEGDFPDSMRRQIEQFSGAEHAPGAVPSEGAMSQVQAAKVASANATSFDDYIRQLHGSQRT